jgi:hypothetical protein
VSDLSLAYLGVLAGAMVLSGCSNDVDPSDRNAEPTSTAASDSAGPPVTEPSVTLTCRPKKSPLSPVEYFDARNLINHAEITSSGNLVLVGPDVVLTYSRYK